MWNQPTAAHFIPHLVEPLNHLRFQNTEHCYLAMLNQGLEIIAEKKITSSKSSDITIPIENITALYSHDSKYLVIIHNHPSQTVHPSQADYHSTHTLIQLGDLLGFKVLDHIIVTSDNYFSFAEAGILEDIKSQFS